MAPGNRKTNQPVRSKHRQPSERLARTNADEDVVSLHRQAKAIVAAARKRGGSSTAMQPHERTLVRAAQGTVALRAADGKKKDARKRAQAARRKNR